MATDKMADGSPAAEPLYRNDKYAESDTEYDTESLNSLPRIIDSVSITNH